MDTQSVPQSSSGLGSCSLGHNKQMERLLIQDAGGWVASEKVPEKGGCSLKH